jgi:hypothetical protein
VKRFRRFILNAATLLSMLLCIGSSILWVRGMNVGDAFWWGPPGTQRNVVVSATHRLYFYRNRIRPGLWVPDEFRNAPPPRPGFEVVWSEVALDHDFGFRVNLSGEHDWHGFGGWSAQSHVETNRCWFFPIACVTVPAGLFVVTRAILALRSRLIRRRRFRNRICLVCGYDLRATPVRCPECGTDVQAAT